MTRAEVHEPPYAVSSPVRLTERLAALTMPCPVHPSIHLVEAAASDWARAAGLPPDPAASWLAGRAFARCETRAVTLLARWLTWGARLREEPAALPPVLAVAAGGEPGTAPLTRAFADLWGACAPRMSDAWRERFTAGLATGEPPNAFGRLPLDLVEPCYGVEVPAPVRRSPRWRALVEASGDVTTWCAEAAAGHDGARGAFLERSNRVAEERVIDRVAARMEELWTAARAIPALTERHDLGFATSQEVTRVACAFLTIPRAYLEWLLETPRYRHLG
ncbi:terpene synthase family protein [Streptosporangium amethystogenes]|uniref:terpene synthase family protein n=1 Tax=Streptosporangium amethystogenes TaxID=2002 RepID=UPI0004C9FD17|nr:terpene synthase family protein [Streptosporangium amethystogenes]